MSISFEKLMIIGAALIVLDIFIIFKIIMKKLTSDKKRIADKKQNANFLYAVANEAPINKSKTYLNSYASMKQAFQLDRHTTENIERLIDSGKCEKVYLRKLNSIYKTTRIEAAVYLGLIGTDDARLSLENAMLIEKDYTVKLYMANSLCEICNKKSIKALVQSLMNSHRWYRNKVNMLISDFGEDFNQYLPNIINIDRIEIKELIVDFSSVYFADALKAYLINVVDNYKIELDKLHELYSNSNEKCCAYCMHCETMNIKDKRLCKIRGEVDSSFLCYKYKILPVSINSVDNYKKIVYKSCEILASYYPKSLDDDKYLKSDDIEIKNIAVKALSNYNSDERINKLISLIKSADVSRSVVHAISKIIEKNPHYIIKIANAFQEENDIKAKKELANVLSNKIEYFIMKLLKQDKKVATEIIKEIIVLGKTSEIIDFLNKNKNIDIENELISIIKSVIFKQSYIGEEFSRYLNKRIADKCGLKKIEEKNPKKEEKKDKNLTKNLYILLFLSIILFPCIYLIRHNNIIFEMKLIEQIKIYVIDFNYYIAYYSIAINMIYIILLLLSNINLKKQIKLWKIKSTSLLFKKKMLPSISIIAPAYNEEKTIIESANSLLNLKYPDYELILVNDGSKDQTFDVLIKYFNLSRIDYIFDYNIKTKPIRGIYMNSSMPKLIVIDKENGGKADSLNAGINISKKEYFCGIDADSLLENDALLKLASLTLDEDVETPALGGNIFPINGCTVERGQIKEISIPKNDLARFQTIEYVRSFMSGRLGWAYLNSLLIISGAFGLFRKDRVIDIGGYLSSSGRYAKDTVGEDMELVVRISKNMLEKKHKYKICYAFNANCWTEVPEDFATLKKQRYRWHRGLIDILTYHRKMIFNPKYGKIGLLSMPYFFIFEMMGPVVEIQGYIMVVLAIIFGLLNKSIALLLFIASILMGILISVSSLLIAEKDSDYFKLKDILILILYGIIENFGPRQIISLWRVGGYLNILKNPASWDKAERKGFANN